MGCGGTGAATQAACYVPGEGYTCSDGCRCGCECMCGPVYVGECSVCKGGGFVALPENPRLYQM